jgi:hypothetical protein
VSPQKSALEKLSRLQPLRDCQRQRFEERVDAVIHEIAPELEPATKQD